MKIQKWVDYSQEVEIELSAEDIQLIFDSDSDSLPSIFRCLNSVAAFLKGISDGKIEEMDPGQRKVITEFLTTQAARFV